MKNLGRVTKETLEALELRGHRAAADRLIAFSLVLVDSPSHASLAQFIGGLTIARDICGLSLYIPKHEAAN